MPHDPRYVASLIIALTAVLAPGQFAAAQSPAEIDLAQAPPPPAQDATEEKNDKKAGKRQQHRQQQSQPGQDQGGQPTEGQQDGGKKRQGQNQRQEKREQQQEKQKQDRAQRQEDLQRRLEERQQQLNARQQRLEEQQRQKNALQEQRRQQLEADKLRKQQDNERVQQERAQTNKQQGEQRPPEDVEQIKKQQDLDRARQDGERQKQEAERVRPQQDNNRQRQDGERRKARDNTTLPPIEGSQSVRDGRPQFPPTVPNEANRDSRRDVSPPPGQNNVQIVEPTTKKERRRFRAQEIRQSYRQAPPQQRSFDDLKRNRRERSIGDGKLRVIEEPDRRVIVKQDNRTFIRHDESERFRRISPDARTIRRADGTSTTFIPRRGGIRIYDVTDRNGRLLYRYRRYPNGREVVLIDNRRYYQRDRNRSRDVLIGAGIGLVIGSAIALSAPEVRIPRDRYIVDYGRASDDDLYEALTAPPLERLDRGYSLEEVRYSSHLRDRMRRIDLDTVTFDFGSWEIGPDQGRALDRLAEGINRVLARDPDEIFMIEGHTDAVGSQEDNLTLSDRRAQSVAEILTTEYGVAPENLVTQGYGEEQLKIPTDGPERANRRITVRRIGPLLSGRVDDDRYSGGDRDDDRYSSGSRDDERYDERAYEQDREYDRGR